MKATASLLLLATLVGCSRLFEPGPHETVTVSACSGPAMSLPDSLAALVPPRDGSMVPDDQWADLATTVPGGFAGVFYVRGELMLALTRPNEAAAAKAALAGKLSVPVEGAEIRPVRWDFAQLVDWSNYIVPRLHFPIVLLDRDEVLNRIRISGSSVQARDRIVDELRALRLPCDLVVVNVMSGTIRAD
jgi:hypothetical protein